jgi:hypothetical protein
MEHSIVIGGADAKGRWKKARTGQFGIREYYPRLINPY